MPSLSMGAWHLTGARTIRPDQLPQDVGEMVLPTDLTVRRMQKAFKARTLCRLWALPGFIGLLDSAGFSAVRHRLHFQALLGAAAAVRHDGAGGGRIFDAAGCGAAVWPK